MKASEIEYWHPSFKDTEWPDGVLENMNACVITAGVFPLRDLSKVPMWPSALFDAHIRPTGTSRHSIDNGKRLADATDMHCKTLAQLRTLFISALAIEAIGGIGLYFDTNTPMIHVDMRPGKMMWLRVEGEYIYAHHEPEKFGAYLTKMFEGV